MFVDSKVGSFIGEVSDAHCCLIWEHILFSESFVMKCDRHWVMALIMALII